MIRVDPTDPTPPFEQIRVQISARIANGDLPPNSRLPSIRQLAGDLRLAPGTVARAYKELEADGLVASSRASGTRVLPGHQIDDGLRSAALEYARAARRGKVGLAEALAAVRTAWEMER